jgi:hypothetical protein
MFMQGRQISTGIRSEQSKSRKNGCSITVDFGEKGFYSSCSFNGVSSVLSVQEPSTITPCRKSNKGLARRSLTGLRDPAGVDFGDYSLP